MYNYTDINKTAQGLPEYRTVDQFRSSVKWRFTTTTVQCFHCSHQHQNKTKLSTRVEITTFLRGWPAITSSQSLSSSFSRGRNVAVITTQSFHCWLCPAGPRNVFPNMTREWLCSDDHSEITSSRKNNNSNWLDRSLRGVSSSTTDLLLNETPVTGSVGGGWGG